MSKVIPVSQQKSTPWSAFLKAGGLALMIALVVNLALYFIGAAAGQFPPDALGPMGDPVNAIAMGIATTVAAVGMTLGYGVLRLFFAKSRANTIFLVLSIAVFIFMFFNPFNITNVPVGQIVILELAHVVAMGFPWYFLTRTA